MDCKVDLNGIFQDCGSERQMPAFIAANKIAAVRKCEAQQRDGFHLPTMNSPASLITSVFFTGESLVLLYALTFSKRIYVCVTHSFVTVLGSSYSPRKNEKAQH